MKEIFFSRFNFEYLSFVAYLKNNVYLESPTDEDSIQRLKNDKVLRAEYMAQIYYHRLLKKVWNSLIEESQQNLIDQKNVIQNLEDWENMVEFWIQTRKKLYNGESVSINTDNQSHGRECLLYTFIFYGKPNKKNLLVLSCILEVKAATRFSSIRILRKQVYLKWNRILALKRGYMDDFF